MKFKIGVFGSAEGNISEIITKARALGKELGKKNIIVVTGASTGLPYEASVVAKKEGAQVWGYSAGIDLKTQEKLAPKCNSKIYDKLIYIPKEYLFASNHLVCRKYRNVTSTANCDAGLIICGRWGTMNEFTNLYDMGKIIGVLTNTGGIADELPKLMKKIKKKSRAKVFFNSSPKALVEKVLNELEKTTN